MNPHIFRINIIEECFFKYIYMTTPTSIFMSGPKGAKNGTLAKLMSGPKGAKNGTLAKQTLGVTDSIYSVYIQLNFGSNMGEIPPGYTTSQLISPFPPSFYSPFSFPSFLSSFNSSTFFLSYYLPHIIYFLIFFITFLSNLSMAQIFYCRFTIC